VGVLQNTNEQNNGRENQQQKINYLVLNAYETITLTTTTYYIIYYSIIIIIMKDHQSIPFYIDQKRNITHNLFVTLLLLLPCFHPRHLLFIQVFLIINKYHKYIQSQMHVGL